MPKRKMSEAVESAILNMRGQMGVDRMLAERGGMSRSDLLQDQERKSASPLGHGMEAKEPPKRKHEAKKHKKEK